MLFLRVIAWYGAEKISLKKSCFYLYIRRDTFGLWSASTTGQRSYVYDKGTTYASHCKTRVSVAMSVYKSDNPDFFDRALSSITDEQTIKPNEIVLVVDGPVSNEINNVINKYEKKYEVCVEIL